jgi:4a-hydroxytetrahydrobiopterin dehydratase
MSKKLPELEVARELAGLTGWSREGDAVKKTYVLPTFTDAIAFVNRVARAADAMDHHPDMDIRYNKVSFTLSTHSEGGLTSLDFDLARRIETLSR